MKTVVIWDTCEADVRFAVLEGDYRHLNHVYINQVRDTDDTKAKQKAYDKLQNELEKIFYTKDGKDRQAFLDEFPVEEVKNGAFVVVAGFLP